MGKRHYSDADRADALAVLDSCGGALEAAARQTGVSRNTLRSWAQNRERAAPLNIRQEKRDDLADLIQGEIRSILDAMNIRRDSATYRELATAFGIMVDKRQLLIGEPTVRTEEVGALTPEQAVEMLRRYDADKD